MTLKTVITADLAAGGAFFPTDSNGDPSEFNQTIEFYPKGAVGSKSSFNGIVHRDAMMGTNEVPGDSRVLNRREGRTVRETVMVDAPATVAIRERQPERDPDVLKFDSEFWSVKRMEGKDADVKTWLCVRLQDVTVIERIKKG